MKAERVQSRLEQLPEWEAETAPTSTTRSAKGPAKPPQVKAIRRTFQFSCFIEAMAFVDRVADVAWEMRVNPAILVHDEIVNIRIPGDGSGVKEVDFDLAEAIDDLVA